MSKNILSTFKGLFPKLRMLGLSERVYEKSQELRRKFDLGIFDSIHAATAMLNNEPMASTDKAYAIVAGLKMAK